MFQDMAGIGHASQRRDGHGLSGSLRGSLVCPVLVYLAEDSLPIVRERVEGIARHRGLQLDSVPIHVLTAPVLRLDREPHRTQMRQGVAFSAGGASAQIVDFLAILS